MEQIMKLLLMFMMMLKVLMKTVMGCSRIFDWGGPGIDEAQDAGQNVPIFALKSWLIGGGGLGPVAPPPLEPKLKTVKNFNLIRML